MKKVFAVLVVLGVVGIIGVVGLATYTYLAHTEEVYLVAHSSKMGIAIAENNMDKATGSAFSVARCIQALAQRDQIPAKGLGQIYVDSFVDAFEKEIKASALSTEEMQRRWDAVRDCVGIILQQTQQNI